MQEDTPKIVVTMPGSSGGRMHKPSTVYTETETQHSNEVALSRRTSYTWSYHTASLEDPLDGYFSVHGSSHSINQLPGLSPLLSHQLHVPQNRSGNSLDSMCDSENDNAQFLIPNMPLQNIGSGRAWKPEYNSLTSNKVSFTLGGKIPIRTLSPPSPKTVDFNENNEMSFQVKTKINDNKHYLSLPDANYDRNGISLMDTSNNNTIPTASNRLQQQTVELKPLSNMQNADKKVNRIDGAFFSESSHL